MKRIASLILALALIFTMIPVSVQAAEIDGEDPILDYGTIMGGDEAQSVELMSSASDKIFKMADVPAGGKYKTMSTSPVNC